MPTLAPDLARIISYGYAETGWKDLLTSYNGQTITYDEIGNPLTYRARMMQLLFPAWRKSRGERK